MVPALFIEWSCRMQAFSVVCLILYTLACVVSAAWFYGAFRDSYEWGEYTKSATCLVIAVLIILSPFYVLALWK